MHPARSLLTSTSTGVGHWLLCSLIAAALAFPIVFGVLDHHAAERLPTHGHLTALGEITRVHLHEFQAPHQHVVTAEAPWGSVDGINLFAASSGPQTVVYLLAVLALPLMCAVVVLTRENGRARVDRRTADGQREPKPLTPPPTLLFGTA